jgi:hypothetical protein
MGYEQSEWLDRGDPLALAQDRMMRGLSFRSSAQEQAKALLPASGLDNEVGTVLGISDHELPMPTGISPSARSVEPWRRDAFVLTEHTISFAKGKR